VLNVCDDERWKTSIMEIFNCLEPVELDDVKYVLFNHEINWDVINALVHSIGKVPQILTLENVITIMQSIIYEWFDIRYMRNT
ncbi:non-structural protein 1, partial [Rotavirus A]